MVSLVFYLHHDVCLGTYDCGTIIHLPSSRIKRPTCPLAVVAASDHGLLHILSTCMSVCSTWILSWLIYVQTDVIR